MGQINATHGAGSCWCGRALVHLHVLDWSPAGAVVVGMGEEQLGVVARHEEPEAAGVVVEDGGALTDRCLVGRVGGAVHELEWLPRSACDQATRWLRSQSAMA